MEENNEINSMETPRDMSRLNEKFERLTKSYEKAATETAIVKIQKVPFSLRGHKHFKKYFEPRAFALGPIHHGKPALEHFQEYKQRLAEYFIRKNGCNKYQLYNEVEKDIKNLRECYADGVTNRYDDEKLAWMLFVDGSSLLAFIDCTVDEKSKMKEMKIKNDLAAFGLQDVFLLENQLPFRLLKLLINQSAARENDGWIKKINDFVDEVRNHTITLSKSGKEKSSSMDNLTTSFSDDCPHLLHLLRRRLLGDQDAKNSNDKQTSDNSLSSKQKQTQSASSNNDISLKVDDSKCCEPFKFGNLCKSAKSDPPPLTFRNIKELRSPGIGVSPNQSNICLKNIYFRKVKMLLPTLFLPPIVVDDWTAQKFMNLVAYEMCPDFFDDFGITSYVCFLDFLIDHPEDVKHLREKEILHNVLGSDEEVAILFNEISRDLVQDDEAYSTVKKAIQRHYKKLWTRLVMEMDLHRRFSNPWTVMALGVGSIALAWNFVQAFVHF